MDYTVVETAIGVDGNRDRSIDFANSHDRQLLFWINDDQETVDAAGFERDAVERDDSDNTNHQIDGRRDLEDFAPLRLHVDQTLGVNGFDTTITGSQPDPNQLRVEYRLLFNHAFPTLARLYYSSNSIDKNDVYEHVSDAFRAKIQATEPLFRNALVPALGDEQLRLVGGGIREYLMEFFGPRQKTTLDFETTVIYPDGGKTITSQSIALDLRNVRHFYNRHMIRYITNGNDLRQSLGFVHYPDAVAARVSTVKTKPFFSGADNIVFVHGWNMPDQPRNDWKKAYADTAFKRLYWQGFRGNFYAFDWPTFADAEGPRFGGAAGAAANLTYNPSEFQAYRSGRALKNFLANLDGKTHLLAHSMGNVVAAEALRLWSLESNQPLVETYVAMEAAISAGVYGENGTDAFDIAGAYQGVQLGWPHEIHSRSEVDLNRFWSSGYASATDPSGPYMQGAKTAAKKWVNLYNPNDVATNIAWKINNLFKEFMNRENPELPDLPGIGDALIYAFLFDLGFGFFDGVSQDELWRLLPPPEIWSWRYVVIKDRASGHDYFRIKHDIADQLAINDRINLTTNLRDVNGLPGASSYEIIAFMSQANVAPVGTRHVAWFNVNTNIFSATANLIDTALYDSGHFSSHSFQFNHDAAATHKFWSHVKQQTGFGSTH